MGEVAHAAQKAARDAWRAAGAARDLVGAVGRNADAENARAAIDDLFELSLGIEIEPHRNAETVAQRVGQQAGAGGGANQRERREIDLDRTCRRALADNQVELKILHRRVQDFLDRRVETMNLVDEQDVARLEVGQQGGEIAGFGNHRAGCGAEVDAQFARHDLGQRRLSEPRRTDKQHVVERLLASARRFNEYLKIGSRLFLANEFIEPLRAQRSLWVVIALIGGHEPAGIVHLASSFRPCRMSVAVSAPSPALRAAAAIAAAACGWP